MRVLHLYPALKIVCGISNQIITLAKDTGTVTHYIFTFSSEYSSSIKEIAPDRIIIKRITKIPIFREVFLVRHLLNITEQKAIDILHSHHRYFDFIALIVSLFRKIKRVTSVHSIVKGKKLLSYKSPLLIADSQAVKKHLVNYFGIRPKRIRIIHNVINKQSVSFFISKDVLLKRLNLCSTNFIIGYVGRFSIKEKGINLLLEAFYLFQKIHSKTKLVMIGEGNDLKKCELDFENVIILPPVLNIYDYFQIFHCLVLPSLVDPFPVTMLIAGICNVPFIGARVDGISEFITDGVNGLLFKRGDKFDLFNKLESLHYNYEKAIQMAENLKQKVESECNFEIQKQKLYDIYSLILRQNV